MRIAYSYQGKDLIFDRETTQIVIGRPKADVAPDLDLSPDRMVSRPHARLWMAEGQYWIEDLNSRGGTQGNGEDLKCRGQRRLYAGGTLPICPTTLQVYIATAPRGPHATRRSYDT